MVKYQAHEAWLHRLNDGGTPPCLFLEYSQVAVFELSPVLARIWIRIIVKANVNS